MPPMLNCDEVMRQLWDYLDGELTPDRMKAINGHLAMCARCYPQYKFEEEFLGVLGRARCEHSNPSGLRKRVMDELYRNGFKDA